ncbi:aminoglycoside 3'-phosphotransferase [Microbacterium sp. SSW1-59]|uniref:aminoglycoside 3'-phosphotransferase n=1 Tax=Microbacterium xanthum TaxID=3079794 RepID=UPI002AD223A8|nr:aminoglycoside 3'-phosphotransferase [Microbacterium sp. SSW1-59]MDZ8200980.1 aminoglycoside 3'-phosphotransferase [Microbacterium sp. SSW1-59]
MSIPDAGEPVPSRVRAIAGGAGLTPVWRNAIGGVTFRTDDGRYVKYGPRNAETSMREEAERLAWAGAFTPVPHVLDVGGDARSEWLVTVALPGESAVAPRWTGDPARAGIAVRAVGSGLRALHDALPVASCPFDWGVESRVADAARRGIRLPDALRRAPRIDRAVVCHGDACSPNTVIDDNGRVTGHVDLGALGVADRWADIAVAAMSTEWNYGPGWEATLLDAYGTAPDPERQAYYRALWNAT